jgi:hypothetical protein
MRAKPKRKMMMLWSLGLLASLSACAVPGDFCEVVSGPIQFPEQVAAVVVQGARPEAVKIDTQNRYGAARCGWKG